MSSDQKKPDNAPMSRCCNFHLVGVITQIIPIFFCLGSMATAGKWWWLWLILWMFPLLGSWVMNIAMYVYAVWRYPLFHQTLLVNYDRFRCPTAASQHSGVLTADGKAIDLELGRWWKKMCWALFYAIALTVLPILALILHLTLGPEFASDPEDDSKESLIAFTIWGVILTLLPFSGALSIFLKIKFQLRVAEWYVKLDAFMSNLDRALDAWDSTTGAYQLSAMAKAHGTDKSTLVVLAMQMAALTIDITRITALDVVRSMTKKNGGMV